MSEQLLERALLLKTRNTRYHGGHYLMLLQLAEIFVGVIYLFIPKYQN